MQILELDIKDPASLDQFTSVTRVVYAEDRIWAPAAEITLKDLWSAVTAASHLLFTPLLFWEDGRTVARAIAILRRGAVDGDGHPQGHIGFFECLPDRTDAAVAVLGAAETALRAHGVRKVQAPKADNQLFGCQTSGFDLPHLCLTAHNPPFYAGYFEAAGYRPVQRVLTLVFTRELAGAPVEFTMPGFKTRVFDRSRIDDEVAIFHDLQPQIFRGHFGYVPRTLDEDRAMISGLLGLIDDELIIIAEDDRKKAVGILVCIPDFYQTLAGEPADRVRVLSIGIVPGHLRSGIGTLMATHLMRNLLAKHQYQTAEASLVLADNMAPQALAKRFHAQPGREFVVFRKSI